MPERARVTSLEAIEAFRAKLIIYRDKAGRILDEAGDSVVRTRLWLQNDRVAQCRAQIEKANKELKQRQQELFSAKLSGLRDSSLGQQAAVQKAQGSLRNAEAQLQTVKQWCRQFDQRVEHLGRQVDKFRHNLSRDLGIAIPWLAEAVQTLSAYAETSPPGASASPKPEQTETAGATTPPTSAAEGAEP